MCNKVILQKSLVTEDPEKVLGAQIVGRIGWINGMVVLSVEGCFVL
jgi:hypothetical protein